MSEYRILIVEDNPDTRELLVEQLEDDAYEVLTAEDGQKAILVVGERAPDLVIMDVMMPHLDGFETSRYLKLRFSDRFLPIVVLSAKSDAASRAEGARYGCEDYRGKPYTRQQLMDSVEALLELGKLENTVRTSPPAEEGGEDQSEAIRRIIEIRKSLAKRQVGEQSTGIARVHLERILALDTDDAEARAMLDRLDSTEPS